MCPSSVAHLFSKFCIVYNVYQNIGSVLGLYLNRWNHHCLFSRSLPLCVNTDKVMC